MRYCYEMLSDTEPAMAGTVCRCGFPATTWIEVSRLESWRRRDNYCDGCAKVQFDALDAEYPEAKVAFDAAWELEVAAMKADEERWEAEAVEAARVDALADAATLLEAQENAEVQRACHAAPDFVLWEGY